VHQDHKAWAVLILSFGIAMTGLQDTFMKYLSGNYPFHELQVLRCAIAVILVAIAGARLFPRRGQRVLLCKPRRHDACRRHGDLLRPAADRCSAFWRDD
jgi:hypothetical protein